MPLTALFKAAKRGDVIDVRRLLAGGSAPNEGPNGSTPLIAAAARGNTPILTLLLDAGAKPDWYALQAAAFANHRKAVQLLLDAGAPVDAGKGEMPLLNALKYSGIKVQQQEGVRRLLREAGAKEQSETYLWRWSIIYGCQWRLRRLFYALGWWPKRRRHSN